MLTIIHRGYHALAVRVWLLLFDLAPTEPMRLACIARAAHHEYWDYAPEGKSGEPPW